MSIRTDPEQILLEPSSGDTGVTRFQVGGRVYTRTAKDEWWYGDTTVAVPAASDLRLADAVTPGRVLSADGTVEAFLLPVDEAGRSPELAWCASEARSFEISGRAQYFVRPATWATHADTVCGVRAPELHGTPQERLVAIAEREFRLANHAAELAAVRRARAFDVAACGGMTRRALAALVDLSPTRVQQLADDARIPVQELQPADLEALWILDAAARTPHIELAELQSNDARDQKSTREAARRLVDAGLITTGRTSDALVLTPAGREYLQYGRKGTSRGRANQRK